MYRFEKKYILPKLLKNDFLNLIRSYPFNCYKLFSPRLVNNIYFDTLLLQNYFSNISGDCDRKKYRLRWYGSQDHMIENSNFEIKIKKNDIGSKIIYPIEILDIEDLKTINKKLSNLDLPNQIKHLIKFLKPTLSNQYYRHYFKTYENELRITLDEKLINKSLLNKINTVFKEENILIIEFKYGLEYNSIVSELTSRIPLRRTKYSKYINGLLSTNEFLLE